MTSLATSQLVAPAHAARVITRKPVRATFTAFFMAVLFTLFAAPAEAATLAPDVAGDRISWDGYPCFDGSNGLTVNTQPRYSAPSAGSYAVQLYLFDGAGRVATYQRLAYIRLTAPTRFTFPRWLFSWSSTGEYSISALVYKWNGSAYQFVARESFGCW